MEGGGGYRGNIFLPTMQCWMLKSWSENIFKSSLICKLILPLDQSMIEPFCHIHSEKKNPIASFFAFLVSQAYFLFSSPKMIWAFNFCLILKKSCPESESQGRRFVLTTGRLFLFCHRDTPGHSGTVRHAISNLSSLMVCLSYTEPRQNIE